MSASCASHEQVGGAFKLRERRVVSLFNARFSYNCPNIVLRIHTEAADE